jgi:hypothetical protein
MRKPSRRESGQAAVETAIVMPLFVFIVLGIVQLSLMHQARLLTKYAAYKSVRAGALNRADLGVMEKAAIAVMLPMITRENPISGGDGRKQPQYGVYKSDSASNFLTGFKEVSQSRNNTSSSGKKIVEVTICHPLSSDVKPTDDFDDHRTNPLGSNSDWRKYETTKLAGQVTMYLTLIIPFANAFLWWSSIRQMDGQRVDTMKMLRMKTDKSPNDLRKTFKGQTYTLTELKSEAERGNYIMPIRASFSMRMHSNLAENASLPSENKCHIPFDRK